MWLVKCNESERKNSLVSHDNGIKLYLGRNEAPLKDQNQKNGSQWGKAEDRKVKEDYVINISEEQKDAKIKTKQKKPALEGEIKRVYFRDLLIKLC